MSSFVAEQRSHRFPHWSEQGAAVGWVSTVIIILSEPSDATAEAVAQRLCSRGKAFEWLDRAAYPAVATLEYTVGPDRAPSRRLRVGLRSVDLDEVSAIWWRRPGRVCAAPSLKDPELRSYVESSAEEVFSSVFDDIDCLHVPARRAVVRRAREKIPQLSLARALGLEVPDTLVTNDPAELLNFYHRHRGRVVTKTTAVGVDAFIKNRFSGYTRMLRPRDLCFLHDVALCPITAQAYVDKRLELRVTVVGDAIFAAEIHSQETRRTRVDWRHYDDRHTMHRVHSLPDTIAASIRELTRSLGLAFAAIDFVFTPDGRYVFLEVNPSGQYQWIEDATGLPISDQLAKLLSDGK